MRRQACPWCNPTRRRSRSDNMADRPVEERRRIWRIRKRSQRLYPDIARANERHHTSYVDPIGGPVKPGTAKARIRAGAVPALLAGGYNLKILPRRHHRTQHAGRRRNPVTYEVQVKGAPPSPEGRTSNAWAWWLAIGVAALYALFRWQHRPPGPVEEQFGTPTLAPEPFRYSGHTPLPPGPGPTPATTVPVLEVLPDYGLSQPLWLPPQGVAQ